MSRDESSIVVDRCNAIHVTDRRYIHSRSKARTYLAFIRIGGIKWWRGVDEESYPEL